ncbi:flavin-containing monooxygenase [Gordonia jinghuaiqii]|uniref:flavin-containing monooxygenase n=1 Tax=Gordonia jinghuaiqii TaxID=2758710 RepID=UPI001FD43BEF|nr:NAD(P)/FAD-dependent oxidoreductase [Gordonia jinghuaiqii]
MIVGAGLSGVDCAYRLREQNPGADYLILERRRRMGGTWDLFRYPGVRSDSDIYTLSYPFEPWRKPRALAHGDDIREYIEDTAHKYGIADHIRFEQHVVSADWDSATDTWTLTVEVGGDGDGGNGDGGAARRETHRCRFLVFATGYYDYDNPYTPQFAGAEDFAGQIVHPQHWPEDLDHRGKRVVVIGSGATAVSLIPSLADSARHVTMLQRSPSYIFSANQKQYLAPLAQKLLSPRAAHRLIRFRYATQTAAIVHLTHRFPKLGRKLIRSNVAANLPADYPIDVHFNPTYNPWDQRMCMVPDADLFQQIASGAVEMVTDHIDRFDETGVRLTSGRHLDADIIVTATGLQLLGFGGTRLRVDGAEVKPHDRFVFKSHLLEDVPNLAWSVGYTNASWTLRADMTARAVADLVKYMRRNGYTHAYPHLGSEPMTARPVWDLKAGYVERSPEALPKSGTRGRWQVRHNYYRDAIDHRIGKVEESMVFGRHP